MKYLKSTLILLLVTSSAGAQQLPLQSQYLWNDFIINPAIAGTKDCAVVMASYRRQWTGLKDAPNTVTGSGHGAVTGKIGLGAAFISDHTGPSSNTSLQLAYSYKINLNEKNKLSFGLAPMIMQYQMDKGALTTDVPNDAAIERLSNKVLTADLNLGLYFYGEKYFAGASVPQVFESKIRSGDTYASQALVRHYYVNGGYKFKLNEQFVLEPSFLYKHAETLPMELDVNVKAMYKELAWLGISYRTDMSVAGMLGITSHDFSFGYCYDYTLSDLRKYSSGSHELFLIFNMKCKQKESTAQMQ